MLTLDEARATNCCRLCDGQIIEPGSVPMGYPAGWKDDFREMLFPVAVTLNFGEEFAHTSCYKKAGLG